MSKVLKEARIIKYDEFKKHDKRGDCWIQIEDMIFDVSQWMERHPGGIKVIECLGGKDGTFSFQLNHTPDVWHKYLHHYFIGYLEESAVSEIYKDNKKWCFVPGFNIKGYKPKVYDICSSDSGSDLSDTSSNEEISRLPNNLTSKDEACLLDYRKLHRQLLNDGYFVSNPSYFICKFIWIFFILAMSVILFEMAKVDSPDSLLYGCFGAALLGLYFQQIAFMGHDIGHVSVTQDEWWDNAIGIPLGAIGMGISLGWWKSTHNVHHIRTNDVTYDPDVIGLLPVLTIAKKHLEDAYSKFHDKWYVQSKFSRFMAKIQHISYIPILLLAARNNLHIESFLFAIFDKTFYIAPDKLPYGRFTRCLEAIGILIYMYWSHYLLLWQSGHPVLYWVIMNMVVGILHFQIVSNHLIMDTATDLHPNFLYHQLTTSTNITYNRWTNWFGGGLQWQVEHHLFPRMLPHNLSKVKPLVQQLCARHNIKYPEISFMGALTKLYYVFRGISDTAAKQF